MKVGYQNSKHIVKRSGDFSFFSRIICIFKNGCIRENKQLLSHRGTARSFLIDKPQTGTEAQLF